MDLIADMLMMAGTLGVAFYCAVLSRRLTRFNDLEKGVGGAIAVLSAQVDDLTRTLKAAQAAASGSSDTLTEITSRAEDVARRLELHVAAMYDLPETAGAQPATPQATAPARTASAQTGAAQTDPEPARPAAAPAEPAPAADAAAAAAAAISRFAEEDDTPAAPLRFGSGRAAPAQAQPQALAQAQAQALAQPAALHADGAATAPVRSFFARSAV